jgi:hypothetical protein
MEENEMMDELVDEEEAEPIEEESEEPTEDEEDAAEGGDGEGGTDDGDTGEVAPDRVSELEAALAEERKKGSRDSADLKRLLEAIGYSDVDSYLAEQAGISREEFIEKQRDAELLAQAKAQAENGKYEKMMADDLAALKSAGLVDSSLNSIRDLDCVKLFAEFRDKGLTAEQAYRAAAGSKLDTRIEQGARRAASGKDHLTTPKSRGTSGHGSVMSRREFEYYSELLGTTDRKVIESAYNRAQASMK